MRGSLLLAFLALLTPMCFADGGQMILHQTISNLEISVFASPVPLVTGDADLSLLAEDSALHQTVALSGVEILLRSPSGKIQTGSPSLGLAANRLLRSESVRFDEAGIWRATLRFRDEKGTLLEYSANFVVERSQSRTKIVVVCLLVPLLLIELFIVHQRAKLAISR